MAVGRRRSRGYLVSFVIGAIFASAFVVLAYAQGAPFSAEVSAALVVGWGAVFLAGQWARNRRAGD